MKPLLPRHKRTAELRESAYELKEALNALLVEHTVLSDVYQAMLQARFENVKDTYEIEPNGFTESAIELAKS